MPRIEARKNNRSNACAALANGSMPPRLGATTKDRNTTCVTLATKKR